LKKIYCAIFIFLSLACLACAEEAQPIDACDFPFARTPLNKLGRGLMNTATFYLELPAAIWDVSAKREFISGWTMGTLEGMLISLVRLGTGLFDAATFLIPPYNKPLMLPEYAHESAIQKMSQNGSRAEPN
jgi:putative exosortase-associated protein (TIGR04073 family)